MKFYKYFYYRIAHAYMNFGWSNHFSYQCSRSVVGINIMSNIISLVLIVAYFTVGGIQFESLSYLWFISLVITTFILIKVFSINCDDDKFFDELNLKYKDEKFRIIKGCLVFLFELISVCGCIILTILLV